MSPGHVVPIAPARFRSARLQMIATNRRIAPALASAKPTHLPPDRSCAPDYHEPPELAADKVLQSHAASLPAESLTRTLCMAQNAIAYSIRLELRLTDIRAVDSRTFTNSPSRPGTISAPSFVTMAWALTSTTFH